jgi:hypothetical protein
VSGGGARRGPRRTRIYGSAYAVLGSIADIFDAGYFSAGAERVARADVEWMSVPLEKIRRRLASRERGERPAVVLLTTGAFSPVHSGHIQMMESARAELEARGYFVAGGYLSPSHDSYVSTKLGEQALPRSRGWTCARRSPPAASG